MRFAAIILLVSGLFSVIQGLAAVIGPNTYYAVSEGDLWLLNAQGWGWTNLILGALLIATGFGLFTETGWARVTAIILAVLSAVVQMFLVPLQPWWSFIVIAVDITIIYAVVVRTAEIREAR
ncbi:DUF7144 family membrane protein [Mycetocola miduiensis]|uniref:DUF7144 domain-containing protein n=1 Tax=Mycetocola miduiensis TaxID=995034 RepID=A0A1I5ABY8_9MICO|nr:hypothetical protein [Mycetocola miduiensis]SFN59994.1 hypothetical protein SAMN05216219_1333 [Mycetocola miduiensis]